MRSLVCNAKKYCCITPAVLNKIGNVHAVYEGFGITESYDIYTFVLESLFQMSTYRTKGTIHAICSDKCMPKTILIQ